MREGKMDEKIGVRMVFIFSSHDKGNLNIESN